MNQKTSHHHTIKTVFTFAVILPLFCLIIAKGDDILLPEMPATNWQKEALPLENSCFWALRERFFEDFLG